MEDNAETTTQEQTERPAGLTEAQWQLVQLDRQKAEVNTFFEKYKAAVQAVVQEHANQHYSEGNLDAALEDPWFQDDEGVVYTIVEPKGKFVYYEKLAVHRTRRPGEAKGDLSLTDARARGFVVEGK